MLPGTGGAAAAQIDILFPSREIATIVDIDIYVGIHFLKRLGGFVRAASFGRQAATPTGVATTQFSDDVARQSLNRFGKSGKGLKRAAAAALFAAAATGTYIGLTNRDKRKKQKKLQKQSPQSQQQAKSLYGSDGGKKKQSSSMFGFHRRSLSSDDSSYADSDEQLEKRLTMPLMRGAMTKLSTAGSRIGGAGTKVYNKTKSPTEWKRTAAATTLAAGAIGGGFYATYHYATEADKKQHAKERAAYDAQKAAYDKPKAEYEELQKATEQMQRDLPEEHVDLIHRRSIGQDISDDGHSAAHLEKRLGGITRAVSRWGTKSKPAYPELKETSLRASPSAGKWRAEGWKAKATGGVLGVGILGGIGYGVYKLEDAQKKAWKKEVKEQQKLHPASRRRDLSVESVDLIGRSMSQDTPDAVNVVDASSVRLERRIGGVTRASAFVENEGRAASTSLKEVGLQGSHPSTVRPKKWKKYAGAVAGVGVLGGFGYGTYALDKAQQKEWEKEQKKQEQQKLHPAPSRRDVRDYSDALVDDRANGDKVDSSAHLEKRIGGVTKAMTYWQKTRTASNMSRQSSLSTSSSFGKPSSLSTSSSLSKSSSLGKGSAFDKERTGWKTKAAAVTLGVGLHGAAGYGIYKLVESTSTEPKKHQRRDVSQESLGFVSDRSITELDPVGVASDLTLEKRRLPSLFKFNFGKSTSVGGSRLAAGGTRNVATSSKWRDNVLTPGVGAEELSARTTQQAIDAEKVQNTHLVKRWNEVDAGRISAQTTFNEAQGWKSSTQTRNAGVASNLPSTDPHSASLERRAGQDSSWNQNTRPLKKARTESSNGKASALNFSTILKAPARTTHPNTISQRPASILKLSGLTQTSQLLDPNGKPLKSSLRSRRGFTTLQVNTDKPKTPAPDSLRREGSSVTFNLPESLPSSPDIRDSRPESPDPFAAARDRRDRLRAFHASEFEKYRKHPGVVYQFDAFGKRQDKWLGEGGKWPEKKILGIKRPWAIGIGTVASIAVGGALIGVGAHQSRRRSPSEELPPSELSLMRRTIHGSMPAHSHPHCSYRAGSSVGLCPSPAEARRDVFVVQRRGLVFRSMIPQFVLSKDSRTSLIKRVPRPEDGFVTAPSSPMNSPPSSPRGGVNEHLADFRGMLQQAANLKSTQRKPAKFTNKPGQSKWVQKTMPASEFVFTAGGSSKPAGAASKAAASAAQPKPAFVFTSAALPKTEPGKKAGKGALRTRLRESETATDARVRFTISRAAAAMSQPPPSLTGLDKGKAPMQTEASTSGVKSPEIRPATPSPPRPSFNSARSRTASFRTTPRSPDEFDRWMRANKPFMTKEEYDKVRPSRKWKGRVGKAALVSGVAGIIGYGIWDLDRLISSEN
ncbi:hypothetical protein CBOM_00534 [Ceraceosorus bombacis]|uniref:Uncharacterized protein n=1 Tax=Ceraceosorus bombacis TaxID=401625 RepID=A0A0P1BAY8_9BASI|nr:hypothetical protein CBOM_00534 [Ceraceosorus bombacis]